MCDAKTLRSPVPNCEATLNEQSLSAATQTQIFMSGKRQKTKVTEAAQSQLSASDTRQTEMPFLKTSVLETQTSNPGTLKTEICDDISA